MDSLEHVLKNFKTDEDLLIRIKNLFERLFVNIMKNPENMCLLFDYTDIDSNSNETPWYNTSRESKIDGDLIRRGLILATSIVQVNAAKAYIDLNVLNFYLTEKQNLFNSIESLTEQRPLNKNEISFLLYINEKMEISRLANYE